MFRAQGTQFHSVYGLRDLSGTQLLIVNELEMLAILIDIGPPRPKLAIAVPLLLMLISISRPTGVLPPLSHDRPQFFHFPTAMPFKPLLSTSANLAVTAVLSILHYTHPRSGTTHRSKPD